MIREVGSTYLDRYTIVKVISQKGMSFVYLCVDNSLNRSVVLKEVSKANQGRANINYEAIVNEAKLLSTLSHPGIPRIFSINESPTDISILMDLVSGKDMESIVFTDGAFSESTAVSKMKQLAAILIYLHSLKTPILYRDLKLSNVLLQDGEVKLLDFGISTPVTAGGIIEKPLGTVGYAAPEQARVGTPLDLRSDIYSFGVVLFVLLTREMPNKVDVFDIAKYGSFSPGLRKVILKLTSKAPEDRYQSMQEVLVALQTYDKLDESYLTVSRRKLMTVSGLLGMSLVSLVTSGALYGYSRMEEQNTYQAVLQTARLQNSLDDYGKAVDMRPGEIDPYFDIIDLIKSDGVFNDEEETFLSSLLKKHFSHISQDQRFPELSYRIGHLYWFFYVSKSKADGQALSARWFQTALEGGYNPSLTQTFLSLAVFKRDLVASINTSQDAGMYKTFWGNLITLDTSALGDVMSLQVYNTIVDTLISYSHRLKSDGVPLSDITPTVDKVKKYLESKPKVEEGRPKELLDKLEKNFPQAQTILATNYPKD